MALAGRLGVIGVGVIAETAAAQYQEAMRQRTFQVLTGLRSGVEFGTVSGKNQLRQDVRRGGFSEHMAKSWQDETYPLNGGLAWSPSGYIWSKAPRIVEAYSAATVIRAGAGKSLAVPMPGPARTITKARDEDGRLTAIAGAQRFYGDRLFVIPAAPGRPAILAAKNATITKAGNDGSAGNRLLDGGYRQNAATIFLFWLLPLVRVKKRLNTKRVMRRMQLVFPQAVANALVTELNQ
jgi:hypothetical protein